MKYYIEYQYKIKGSSRPSDDGEVVGIEASDEQGLVILPNVGDYVQIQNDKDRASFSGKVISRLFSYFRMSDTGMNCLVNIVVEETDDDWGALIKE